MRVGRWKGTNPGNQPVKHKNKQTNKSLSVRNKSLSTNSVYLHATYVELKVKYVFYDVALRIIIDVYYGILYVWFSRRMSSQVRI